MAKTSEAMESAAMLSPKSHLYTLLYITFFLLIAGVLFLNLLPRNSSPSLSNFKYHQCTLPNKSTYRIPKDELEEALAKASMANKTIILAVVNKAYVQGKVVPNMLDLFLEGFWAGEGTRELLNHLMVVAMDQTAYERCLFRGLHCYRLVTDGVDFMGEQVYMSNDFNEMMWRRTLFLLDVLKRGYSFIFTDTDVIWLRNPFTILTTNKTQDLDIKFSTDTYNGNSSSLLNLINTGFYYVKSNNKTISLFEKWYGLKENSTGLKEQDVLQDMTSRGVLGELGVKPRILETRFFSGFCEDSPDIRAVVTVHANCCRYISAKVRDLTQVLRDWARLRVSKSNGTTLWSRHVQCVRSWQKKVGNGSHG